MEVGWKRFFHKLNFDRICGWSREPVRVSDRLDLMHSSDEPPSLIAYHTKQQRELQQHSLRKNNIRQKHQIPLASFGWIMLHFLHCRHPFFFHTRAQPAAVAASSVPPGPPGPGPNLVPSKLCQNLAYSCPSLQTFPSPHLHRLATSFNRQPRVAVSSTNSRPGPASLSLQVFPGGTTTPPSRPQVYISRSYRRLSMSYLRKAVP